MFLIVKTKLVIISCKKNFLIKKLSLFYLNLFWYLVLLEILVCHRFSFHDTNRFLVLPFLFHW